MKPITLQEVLDKADEIKVWEDLSACHDERLHALIICINKRLEELDEGQNKK